MTDYRKTSKLLCYILRHDPGNLEMSADGYVYLTDLLHHPQLQGVTRETIHEIVNTDEKHRYSIVETNGKQMIRANQGHSITSIDQNELLTRVTDPTQIESIVHGTYSQNIKSILANGLKAMNRNHIHFAKGLGRNVKSGMRDTCDTYFGVNVRQAMNDGIPFFISQNDVVLSPGLGRTKTIPTKYLVGPFKSFKTR